MLDDINNPVNLDSEQISITIEHKKHLNSLLDKVLQRERLRTGYTQNSRDSITMTDEYLLDDLLAWKMAKKENAALLMKPKVRNIMT